MRFDDFAIRVEVILRLGRATVLCRSNTDGATSVTHLDPALIGKLMHERLEEELREWPNRFMSRSWGLDPDVPRLWDARMEAEKVGASGPANLARTSAMMYVESDGYEARFWGWPPHSFSDQSDYYIDSPALLSSRPPTCPSEEYFNNGNPLHISPWRDPEMLGQGVLSMLEMAGPPLNKDMDSIFDAPVGKRRTKLHHAAEEGSLDDLSGFRRGRRKIDPADTLGVTPLMLAAANGHADFLARLLELGANPALQDHEGRTALHLAAENGCGAAANALVANGAEVDAVDRYGNTPLHFAAANGHAGIAECLLAAGARVNAKDTIYSSTPLHKVARGGHIDVLTALAAGADLNAVNERGRTPLHVAAAYGHTEMTSALISVGVDVNRRDFYGESPLHLSAFYQHLDCMEALIEGGADVAARDLEGDAPLHVAARMNRNRAAALLLDSGDDPDATNHEGLTPLDMAIVNAHAINARMPHITYVFASECEHNTEMAELLLERGTSIDPRRIPVGDRHQLWPHLTPARYLRDTGNIDYYLLPDMNERLREALPPYDKWADYPPYSPAISSPTLLHDAVLKGSSVVVQALLESGALPMTASRYPTPLHFAAAQGDLEMAALLLDWGADVNAPRRNAAPEDRLGPQDREDEAPLDEAGSMGHVDMTRFLLERGASHPENVLLWLSRCPEETIVDMAKVVLDFGLINATVYEKLASRTPG